jgi:hypothetical protein
MNGANKRVPPTKRSVIRNDTTAHWSWWRPDQKDTGVEATRVPPTRAVLFVTPRTVVSLIERRQQQASSSTEEHKHPAKDARGVDWAKVATQVNHVKVSCLSKILATKYWFQERIQTKVSKVSRRRDDAKVTQPRSSDENRKQGH